MKRTLTILALLFLLAGAASVAGIVYLRHYLDTPLAVAADGSRIEIPAGASFASIARELDERNIIRHPELLRLYARWTGQASKVQAGEYLVRSGATPVTLLDQFTRGAVVLYAFTLVEGWNHRELLAALHAHPQVSTTMTEEDWPAFLEELGAEVSSPEGLFLPETYNFPKGASERSILAQAYGLLQAVLDAEWSARSESTPVATPYEALVLASIVEKETARADERERIAGVFTRRLKKNMRLQTDPTVIYGVGSTFDGNLTRQHLQTDTPYNTYTRAGLPPTPICMPGRASIHAALHPAEEDALYFVATGLGDGSHKFSVTAEEHQAAVREYLQRLRRSR